VPPIELALTALAGLGLFFFSLKMVAHNLSAMAGDGLRRNLRSATGTRIGSMLIGVLAGLATQSGRITSFIMASFVQAGAINVARALPVVMWSNLGCALIIFVAVLPIHLAALLVIAIAGGCIAFERPRPLLNTANAAFGLGLMLFGLKMMSAAAPLLATLDGFNTVVAAMAQTPFYAFVAGLVLTLVAQSMIAVILLSIPLAAHGVIGLDQTLLLVCGTQVGASVITWVTGIHFRGEPRQVVIGQILYYLTVVALMLLEFAGERLFGQSGGLLRALADGFGASAATQVALLMLVFNLATPLLLTAVAHAYTQLCARLAPPRGDEDLARPQFLHEEVRDNAATTLLLAEQEQLRLLKRLPQYFAYLRQESPPRNGISPTAYHAAFKSVSGQIRRFQGGLMAHSMTATDTEWLLNQQQRQELLATIEEACHDFCELGATCVRADLQPIVSALTEATDACVMTLIAAMADGDATELDMLALMTSDRGSAMEALRKEYLSSSDSLPPDARSQIVRLTSLFERAAWSLGRFGQLLRTSPALVR